MSRQAVIYETKSGGKFGFILIRDSTIEYRSPPDCESIDEAIEASKEYVREEASRTGKSVTFGEFTDIKTH